MNVNQRVWRLLREDYGILKDLARGIINTRALAKYMIAQYGLDANIDAVVSAIRRYEPAVNFKSGKLLQVFKNANLSTRNGLVCVTIRHVGFKSLRKVLDSFDERGLNGLRIVSATNQTKIMVDAAHSAMVKDAVPKNHIVSVKEGLAEIDIVVDLVALETKGVAAKMASELAVNEVNIEEFLICPPEFLIYVKAGDLLRTHQTLMKLTSE